MTAGNSRTSAEAEIRALVDDQAKAIRARDVDGSLSRYAPDVLLFDVVGPLRRIGADAARKRLAEWFASLKARSATSFATAPSRQAMTWPSATASTV